MEESLVQKCRSWEEEMYWRHFNSMHFCRFLPDDFHDRLALPPKFAKNMIAELPGKVPLISPSGASWDVTLMKANDVAFVGDGWKEFVNTYALEVSSLLMFKYKRNVGFEVLIFDPMSFLEKEDAYFVRKRDKPTIDSNNHDDQNKNRSSAEAFATELIEDDGNNDDSSDFVVSKRVRKDIEDPAWTGETNTRQSPRKLSSGRVKRGGSRSRGRGKPRRGRISGSHLKAKSVGTPKRNKAGKKQAVVENRESHLESGHSQESSEIRGKKQNGNEDGEEHNSYESGEVNTEILQSPKPNETAVLSGDKPNMNEAAKEQDGLNTGASTLEMEREIVCSDMTIRTRGQRRRQILHNSPTKLNLESDSAMVRFAKEYASNRRPVTQNEKENAPQRAQQGLTDNSFIAVMRPSTVYKSFYLNIPSDWSHKFLPRQNHEVFLRVGDKTWPALFYYRNQQKGAGLAGAGWKKFVFDNHLEEFDVCLIKLASQKGDASTIFDVDIFRVIPETVCPSLVVPF